MKPWQASTIKQSTHQRGGKEEQRERERERERGSQVWSQKGKNPKLITKGAEE
jgi:hypothetical protein